MTRRPAAHEADPTGAAIDFKRGNVKPNVIHGDCIEMMRTMPDNSVDSIVTDPPYGLGFMGKAWDALPPGQDWARECLRVLKPGGHLLAFGGTRTWHRLAVAVEDAGFEIRDSIAWMYGSGFPKHRATLKPAFEPIVMARKPFKGSLTANEAIHGTGALDIDGCRVEGGVIAGAGGTRRSGGIMGKSTPLGGWSPTHAGRWPANVALDEAMAEVLDGQSGVSKTAPRGKPSRGKPMTGRDSTTATTMSASRIHRDMPAEYADYGGASRFFKVAESDEHGAISLHFPREFDAFMYSPKAPKSERPNVDGIAHPTVKPLALMRWLVRLVTPDGGTVLDPFAGSGTTLEAAALEGFQSIGIEREAEYLPLIQARIDRSAA